MILLDHVRTKTGVLTKFADDWMIIERVVQTNELTAAIVENVLVVNDSGCTDAYARDRSPLDLIRASS